MIVALYPETDSRTASNRAPRRSRPHCSLILPSSRIHEGLSSKVAVRLVEPASGVTYPATPVGVRRAMLAKARAEEFIDIETGVR